LRTVSVRENFKTDLVSKQRKPFKGFIHQPKKAWKSQYQKRAQENDTRVDGFTWTGTSARMHDGIDCKRKTVTFKHFGNGIRDTFADVWHSIGVVFSLPVILLIMVYRYLISPGLPRSCNFTPTCSHYSLEAVTKYGLIKGGRLAAKRIWRCRGGNPGGYDPVP
jgi:uncharacterized protein